jgi:hypothetical protein
MAATKHAPRGPLETKFAAAGAASEGPLEVDISYDLIRQFSQQLYTNPRKAIEELVCNSYDAGATKCIVGLPQDENGQLVVLDDGKSMDLDGLRGLWHVARSPKNELVQGTDRVDNGRVQIGKFGVGKLAAFALGARLTHVATRKGSTRIVSVSESGIHQYAGDKPAFEVLVLPSAKAPGVLGEILGPLPKPWDLGWKSWTLAVVSEIDPEAAREALKAGVLRRMISTAIPLAANFEVTVDGEACLEREIPSDHIAVTIQLADSEFVEGLEEALRGYWAKELGFEDSKDVPKAKVACRAGKLRDPKNVAVEKPALIVPGLGAVSGYGIMANRGLTGQKLEGRGYQDNGFFIFVHGKLANPEDPLFGLNELSHTFFAKFHARLEIPSLDKALRVQRNEFGENFSEVPLARILARALFNYARRKDVEVESAPEFEPELFGKRLNSLSPIAGKAAVAGLAEGQPPAGGLEKVGVVFRPLGIGQASARYDSESTSVFVNEDHAVVQAIDKVEGGDDTLRPFVGEVVAGTLLTEGILRTRGVKEPVIREVHDLADSSLRVAASFLHDPVERHSIELEDSSRVGGKRFERAIVAAVTDLNLAIAGDGAPGKKDGVIVLVRGGKPNLMVSVEAHGSKGPVDHMDLPMSTVISHMTAAGCTKAVAVAREFVLAGTTAKDSEMVRQSRDAGVPLVTVAALCHLMKRQYQRPFTHDKIEDLLTTWVSPADWISRIDKVWKKMPETGKMKAILRAAWAIQESARKDPPDPGAVTMNPEVAKWNMTVDDVRKIVEALAIATSQVYIMNPATGAFRITADPNVILKELASDPTGELSRDTAA